MWILSFYTEYEAFLKGELDNERLWDRWCRTKFWHKKELFNLSTSSNRRYIASLEESLRDIRKSKARYSPEDRRDKVSFWVDRA